MNSSESRESSRTINRSRNNVSCNTLQHPRNRSTFRRVSKKAIRLSGNYPVQSVWSLKWHSGGDGIKARNVSEKYYSAALHREISPRCSLCCVPDKAARIFHGNNGHAARNYHDFSTIIPSLRSLLGDLQKFSPPPPRPPSIDRARARERVNRARERKGRFIWLKVRLIDLPLAAGRNNVRHDGLKGALSTSSRSYRVSRWSEIQIRWNGQTFRATTAGKREKGKGKRPDPALNTFDDASCVSRIDGSLIQIDERDKEFGSRATLRHCWILLPRFLDD